MKLRLALGSLAMVGAMTVAPVASQAGGLRHGCAIERLFHRAHAAPVVVKKAKMKKVVMKKAAAKPAKKVAAKKPLK